MQAISLTNSTRESYCPWGDSRRAYNLPGKKKSIRSSGDGLYINMKDLLLNKYAFRQGLMQPRLALNIRLCYLYLICSGLTGVQAYWQDGKWHTLQYMLHHSQRFTPGITSESRKHFRSRYTVCFERNASASPLHALELQEWPTTHGWLPVLWKKNNTKIFEWKWVLESIIEYCNRWQ